MIQINQLGPGDVGRAVDYRGGYGIETGKIKSWDSFAIRVVYDGYHPLDGLYGAGGRPTDPRDLSFHGQGITARPA